MIIDRTTCPCCQEEVVFSVHGWFILKEPIAELVACLRGDADSTRPADVPLLGLCTTYCPRCGRRSMVDFKMDVARYVGLIEANYPDTFKQGEEVDDTLFFSELEGDLAQIALPGSLDITCLD
jgi:hypothetical protein